MIWDEIDSGDDFLAYTRVSKILHGGGATEYFKDTQVSVKLMPRKSTAPQVQLVRHQHGPLVLDSVAAHVVKFRNFLSHQH